MQSTVAHALATCAYGRMVLSVRQSSSVSSRIELLKQAKSIVFSHLYNEGDVIKRDPVAQSVAEWANLLKRTGHTRLEIYRMPSGHPLPDWQTAGFVGGGGRWLLGATSPAGIDYWQSTWTVDPESPPHAADWNVEYARIARADQGKPPVTVSLSDCESALDEAIGEAFKFVKQMGLSHYEHIFLDCIDILSKRRPATDMTVMGEASMSELARRVSATAERAWVFGGMGSWNDQGFEGADQLRYEQVSNELYLTVTHSLVSAANSVGNRNWFQFLRN